jgi:hypothetical protein
MKIRNTDHHHTAQQASDKGPREAKAGEAVCGRTFPASCFVVPVLEAEEGADVGVVQLTQHLQLLDLEGTVHVVGIPHRHLLLRKHVALEAALEHLQTSYPVPE